MSSSADNAAISADPDVRTACTLAASLISFCSNHQLQLPCQDVVEVYNRLASYGFKRSAETLNLQKACCVTVLDLARTVPDALRECQEERTEWIELLTHWKNGCGSSVLQTDALRARAALCSLDGPSVPATLHTNPADASATPSVSCTPAPKKDIRSVAVNATSMQHSTHSATVPEATTELAENTSSIIMQPSSVPPSSLMWLNLQRGKKKKMDPGVPKEACSIATKLLSFFGAYLPRVSCDDLDKASIYKKLFSDQDCTNETKALQKACCQKICIAIQLAPGTFRRQESQFKTVIVQWFRSDNDPDLKKEAAKAIAALDPSWSPPPDPSPGPHPVVEFNLLPVDSDVCAKPDVLPCTITSAVEETQPPASPFGTTRSVRLLENTAEDAHNTRVGSDDVDEDANSLSSASTPECATTATSVRRMTPYTTRSRDTSKAKRSSGNIANSVEPSKPVENHDGETTESIGLTSSLDDSEDDSPPIKKKRVHSVAAAETGDELMTATSKLTRLAMSPEKIQGRSSSKAFGAKEYDKIADKAPRKVPLIVDTTGRSALQQLNQNDVVLGRGGGTRLFPGNQAFRCIVWDCKPKYLNSGRMEKAAISKGVVGEVMRQKPPGRFVEMINGEYFIVSFERAAEKAAQALREQKFSPQQSIQPHKRTTKKRKPSPASEVMQTLEVPKTSTKRFISVKATRQNMRRSNSLRSETRNSTRKSRPEIAARVHEQIKGADATELLENPCFFAADCLAVSPSPPVWYIRPPPEQGSGHEQPKLPYQLSTSMKYFLHLRLAEIEIVRTSKSCSLLTDSYSSASCVLTHFKRIK